MNREQVAKVWLTETGVWIELTDGRRAQELFSDYSRLKNADKSQRENYRLSHFGIHWSDIDEDLSFEGFFAKSDKGAESSQKVC